MLLDKSLDVLADGVRLGRQTFVNTLKYVRVTTSANFGNMLSMAAAAAFLPFLPLLPRQILLLNLLSDIPDTTIAGDTVDPELVENPAAWDIGAIRRFMVTFGVASSAFDILTFVVLRAGFDARASLFRSSWFLESTATELAVMLVLRTRRPFWRSRPSMALVWSTVAVAAVTLVLPYSPLADPLGLVDVPTRIVAAQRRHGAHLLARRSPAGSLRRLASADRALTPSAGSCARALGCPLRPVRTLGDGPLRQRSPPRESLASPRTALAPSWRWRHSA